MDYALNNKRRVVRLVLQWAAMYGDLLQEDDVSMAFLEVGGGHPFQEYTIVLQYRDLPVGSAASLERLSLQMQDFVNTFIHQKGTTV